jgi:hypothetical protein
LDSHKWTVAWRWKGNGTSGFVEFVQWNEECAKKVMQQLRFLGNECEQVFVY